MLELRASYVQKYDAVQAEYLPDRTLTPCVLTPFLPVVDSDGIATGDKTKELTNVIWSVDGKYNGANWVNGTDYVIDPDTHQLTIQANMDPGYIGRVSFYGEYLDGRRNNVLKFRWERTMTCETYADYNVQLRMEQSKITLSPWKNRGTFGIPAQLYNSDSPAEDTAYMSGRYGTAVPSAPSVTDIRICGMWMALTLKRYGLTRLTSRMYCFAAWHT